MNNPKISIIIPLYNSGQYIGCTIKSILNQNFKDYELIVVDDSSTDNSVEIVKSFKDNRIKIYQNKRNIGPKGNWNKCLENIKGTYVKLICGDDLLYEGCLQRQLDILENPDNSNVVMVSCNRKIINDLRVLMSRGLGCSEGVIPAKRIIRDLVIKGTNVIGEPAGVLFRKKCLDKMPEWFREPFYTIDVDFWYRLLKFGELYHINESLCAFRISSSSGTTMIGSAQYSHYMIFVKRLCRDYPSLISKYDAFRGKIMTKLQCEARMIFIRFFA